MRTDLKKYAADGFTYLEMLLSLMTAALIMAVMPGILSVFQALEPIDDDYDLDIFTMDIMETYDASSDIKISNASVIQFKTDRGQVSYRYQNGRIIKSIDGGGFVTLMFNIDTFILNESNGLITLKLKGDADETYTFNK